MLGINGQNDPLGCLVTRVYPESPAAKAGLKLDDIITQFASQPVQGLDGLQLLLAKSKAGDDVVLTVRRGDKKLELKARLVERE
jgi:putative serine protease PepD